MNRFFTAVMALLVCLVLAGMSRACNIVSSAVVARVQVVQTAYVVPQVVSVAPAAVCPAPAVVPAATGCVGSAAVIQSGALGFGGYGAFGNSLAFRGRGFGFRGIRRLGGFGFGALGALGLGAAPVVAVDPLTGLPVEEVVSPFGLGGFGRFGARGFGRGFRGARGIRGRGVRRVRR